MDELKRKDVRIGDTVSVRRAGDVIPEIVSVITSRKNSEMIKMPHSCPICGSIIKKSKAKQYIDARVVIVPLTKNRVFEAFVSRQAMDMTVWVQNSSSNLLIKI